MLRLMIEADPEMLVVAEATDIADAERLTLVHRPRVLVLDLNMPGGSSVEAIPRLRERSPGAAIVVITMHDDPAFAAHALQAGASGFVLKEVAEDELLPDSPRRGGRQISQPAPGRTPRRQALIAQSAFRASHATPVRTSVTTPSARDPRRGRRWCRARRLPRGQVA
jgi:DNA-binding NtrC family response regulator